MSSRRDFLKQSTWLIASASPVSFVWPKPPAPITFNGLHQFDEQFFCKRCGRAAEQIVDQTLACN